MPKLTRSCRYVTRVDRQQNSGPEARFGARVQVDDESGCWIFNGKPDRYGVAMIGGGDHMPAHCFAYEVMVGPIEDGNHIHHVCEVKGCVNPGHLVQLTPAEHVTLHNVARAARRRQVD